MSDQLVAEATTYTTNTTDEHPCPRRNVNPRSQQKKPPPPICALDGAANGIGALFLKFNYSPWHPVSQRFQSTTYA